MEGKEVLYNIKRALLVTLTTYQCTEYTNVPEEQDKDGVCLQPGSAVYFYFLFYEPWIDVTDETIQWHKGSKIFLTYFNVIPLNYIMINVLL